MKKIYQIEVGIILTPDYEEYNSYNNVYNKDYSYYNENIWFCSSKKEAIKTAKEYVKNGVENTYAIISDVGKCDNDYSIDESGNIVDSEGYDYNSDFASYQLEDVIDAYIKVENRLTKFLIKEGI